MEIRDNREKGHQDSETIKPTATFRGWQENVPGKEPIALYNIEGGHLDKSTVTAKTLEREGIATPKTPVPYEA